jgi:hypothetical protein
MTTHSTRRDAGESASTGEVGLELSLWDALMVGRVSANRRGLRDRASSIAPNPNTPATSRKEVAS